MPTDHAGVVNQSDLECLFHRWVKGYEPPDIGLGLAAVLWPVHPHGKHTSLVPGFRLTEVLPEILKRKFDVFDD